MSDNETCPDCKGEGFWLGPVDCVAMYEHETVDDCGCPRAQDTCSTCQGSGKLVGVARAVYMARGGAAPTELRSYS
jgi:hypothetical protein